MICGVLMSYQVFSIIDATAASQGKTGKNSSVSNQSVGRTNINVQLHVDQDTVNKNLLSKQDKRE